jgi:signal peptidase I
LKTILRNKTFRDILTIVVIAGVIVIGLQLTVQKFVVDGPSMKITLNDGQQILANKIVYKFHEPERGDIVIFRSPYGDEEDYIKRIIGLPGETVEIKEGIVYIRKEDGTVLQLDETYITRQSPSSFEGEKIPENEYFVMGDNRLNSRDSRNGWTLPRESIIGKAWLSVWPPGDWGLVANHSFEE